MASFNFTAGNTMRDPNGEEYRFYQIILLSFVDIWKHNEGSKRRRMQVLPKQEQIVLERPARLKLETKPSALDMLDAICGPLLQKLPESTRNDRKLLEFAHECRDREG